MKVRELLTDESNWCQGNYARDDKGESVQPTDDRACCWCLVGALAKCYPDKLGSSVIGEVWDKVNDAINTRRPISMWNDDADRTFQDIHDLITTLDI